MRRTTILGLVLLAACGLSNEPGKMKTEVRPVQDFEAVEVVGTGHLILEQGKTPSLRVSAGKNAQKAISSKVRKGVLTLAMRPRKKQKVGEVTYHLVVKDLERLQLNGTVSGFGYTPLHTKTLDIQLSGTSALELDLQVEELKVELSGSSAAKLSGRADKQKVNIQGSSSYHAGDLQSQNVAIEISGAGTAIVDAKEKLDANISGNGVVLYKGDPSIEESIQGAGKITPLSDQSEEPREKSGPQQQDDPQANPSAQSRAEDLQESAPVVS